MNRLLDYQIDIAVESKEKLKKYGMLYLALVPRSGKSYITSYLIPNNSLIVTVKSGIDGWHKALSHFDKNCKVINYESLHKIEVKKYDYLVLDESAAKISGYPKKSKSRTVLDNFIHPDIKVIWLSGNPAIESSAQLFYQLSCSPRHSFSQYTKSGASSEFHHWYMGGDSYKTRDDSLQGFGNKTMKRAGYNKEVMDYSDVMDFSNKVEPIMIRLAEIPDELNTRVHIKYIEAPKEIQEMYDELKTNKCLEEPYIEPLKPAQLLSKLHQLSQGSVKTEDTVYYLNEFKAKAVFKDNPEAIIFYKYIADKTQLLIAGFKEEQLKQIDSNVLGLDLSHYDSLVIFSLTWSGANYLQCLRRVINVENTEEKEIFIYLTQGTVDEDIFKAVSSKRDYNERYLRK